MKEKIGNVGLDFSYFNDDYVYSDGNIEDEILEIVKSNDDYTMHIANDNRWPILYHLSKNRENILSSFKFNNTEHVLEIGSGCGAITGILSKNAKNVDCIEISKKRSLINAYRNKLRDNITIYVGNFNDVILTKKYDVITLIGVFEYAIGYIESDDPYRDFLKKINSMLNDNGVLYIAIENKFGLKYFAGCREDHTGKVFDSIEGYINTNHVKTFAYDEILSMLKQSGFLNNRFYFPFPDYKLPIQIFSEKYLPRASEIVDIFNSYDQDRYILFNEKLAYNNIIDSGYMKIFSNSFLIECKKE